MGVWVCPKCNYRQSKNDPRLPICPRDYSDLYIQELTLEEKYKELVSLMRDFANGMYTHVDGWVEGAAKFKMEVIDESLDYDSLPR